MDKPDLNPRPPKYHVIPDTTVSVWQAMKNNCICALCQNEELVSFSQFSLCYACRRIDAEWQTQWVWNTQLRLVDLVCQTPNNGSNIAKHLNQWSWNWRYFLSCSINSNVNLSPQTSTRWHRWSCHIWPIWLKKSRIPSLNSAVIVFIFSTGSERMDSSHSREQTMLCCTCLEEQRNVRLVFGKFRDVVHQCLHSMQNTDHL